MNYVDRLELVELLDKLRAGGYGPVVNALLDEADEIYTVGGRLKKRALGRVLGWKPSKVEAWLDGCRELLEADLGI